MPNFNHVTLMGHLTRDPELRATQNSQVTKTGLAVNRKWKDKEETCFVDVSFWGKTAEIVAKHFKKGDPIFVSGRLHYESWKDKETGASRNKISIVGENIEFLRPKEKGATTQTQPKTQTHATDDDIPF